MRPRSTRPTSGANKDKLLTGADGTYTAVIAAKELGQTASVSASKRGMTFVPASLVAPAHAGAEITGIDFTGFVNATISGRVIAPGGGPQVGVAISASSTTDATLVVHDTTGVTGTFSLNVPFGGYTIAASLANHIFDGPATGWVVNVAPGQSVNFGAIQAKTAMARDVSAVRVVAPNSDSSAMVYTGSVTVTWTGSSEDVPEGYGEAVYSIQTNTGADGAWADAASATLAGGDTTGLGRFEAGANDGELMVRVVATAQPTDTGDPLALNSDPATLAAIAPTPSGVTARRSVADATTDSLIVAWENTTNSNTAQRVVVRVDLGGSLGPQWLVAAEITGADNETRSWQLEIGDDYSQAWTIAGTDPVIQNAQVTASALRKALMVRVEARQGSEVDDEDRAVWRASSAVSVDAKPDGG